MDFMCFGSLNLFGVNLHCVAPSEAVGSIRAGKDVSWVAPAGFFEKPSHVNGTFTIANSTTSVPIELSQGHQSNSCCPGGSATSPGCSSKGSTAEAWKPTLESTPRAQGSSPSYADHFGVGFADATRWCRGVSSTSGAFWDSDQVEARGGRDWQEGSDFSEQCGGGRFQPPGP